MCVCPLGGDFEWSTKHLLLAICLPCCNHLVFDYFEHFIDLFANNISPSEYLLDSLENAYMEPTLKVSLQTFAAVPLF